MIEFLKNLFANKQPDIKTEQTQNINISVESGLDHLFIDESGSNNQCTIWIRPMAVFVPTNHALVVEFKTKKFTIHVNEDVYRRLKNKLKRKKRPLYSLQLVYPDCIIEHFALEEETNRLLYIDHYMKVSDRA